MCQTLQIQSTMNAHQPSIRSRQNELNETQFSSFGPKQEMAERAVDRGSEKEDFSHILPATPETSPHCTLCLADSRHPSQLSPYIISSRRPSCHPQAQGVLGTTPLASHCGVDVPLSCQLPHFVNLICLCVFLPGCELFKGSFQLQRSLCDPCLSRGLPRLLFS